MNFFKGKGALIYTGARRVDILAGGLGSFLAIATIAFIAANYNSELLIASFGASSVILFGTPLSPFARGRNLILGHTLSASIGVLMYFIFGSTWWAMAIAVSTAICVMLITDSIHPPAGATALIAMLTGAGVKFIFIPVLSGVLILYVWSVMVRKLYLKAINRKNGEINETIN